MRFLLHLKTNSLTCNKTVQQYESSSIVLSYFAVARFEDHRHFFILLYLFNPLTCCYETGQQDESSSRASRNLREWNPFDQKRIRSVKRSTDSTRTHPVSSLSQFYVSVCLYLVLTNELIDHAIVVAPFELMWDHKHDCCADGNKLESKFLNKHETFTVFYKMWLARVLNQITNNKKMFAFRS